MRELESSLQEFGEFLLKAQLARPAAAPYFVRWVRRFLSRPASDEPLIDQVRGFREELERNGATEDWQHRRRRTGADQSAGRDGATAVAHTNPPLLLSHGVHLCGLGAAVS